MEIISFGDIHEHLNNLGSLKNDLKSADLVILTGDLTNYNGRKEAEKVIIFLSHAMIAHYLTTAMHCSDLSMRVVKLVGKLSVSAFEFIFSVQNEAL